MTSKKIYLYVGLVLSFFHRSALAVSLSVNITITNLKSEVVINPFSPLTPVSNGSILTGSTTSSMTCSAFGGTTLAVTISASPGPGSASLVNSDIIKIQVTGGTEKVLTNGTGGYSSTQNLITFLNVNPGPRDVTISYNGNLNRASAALVTNLTFITTAS